jgi:3-oxoacyl-[acyl-carrier-protein] synthase-1/3-oxoacyl-[acyl-carrier-protein] synthase II
MDTEPRMPLLAAPVAVSGMAVVSAAGLSLSDNLASLDAGRAEASPPPFAVERDFPVFRCRVADDEILPETGGLSRTVRLAFLAARQALTSAGLSPEDLRDMRTGVIVGTSIGASLDFLDFYTTRASGRRPPLDDITRYLASNPALALARLLQCSGPAQTVTTACSSGTDAIGIGAGWLRSSLCDIVLAGGADALSPISYAGFCSLRLVSPRPCLPFDAKRSGLTLGEGAAFMVLESARSQSKRSSRAQAFVAGYGTATDAHHLTAPHPEGRGLTAAVNQAFAQAGADWDDVAFINTHGTATENNDAAEAAFFRKNCPSVPFISTKGCTGHTLGAAGAIEAVFTLAHHGRGLLPASPGFSQPDPRLGMAPVSEPTALRGRPLALSQSLAFGGNNSVLLLAGNP